MQTGTYRQDNQSHIAPDNQDLTRKTMESIYYVLCWHCHRRCKHCYEEKFRPYVRDELEAVVAEAERNFAALINNLPARMSYLEALAAADDRRWPG